MDLGVVGSRREQVRRELERAEVLFVARVARDGGIGPWRRHAEERFRVACSVRVSRTDTAALVVSLVDIQVRDRCWLQVEIDRDPAWVPLWLHLVRHALPPFRTEPLFLLGWSAWRLGDAALARAATDAALVEQPGHRAAGMLDLLLVSGTDPDRLPSLADSDSVRRSAR